MAVRVNSGSDNEWHRRQGCLVNTEKCDQSCCVGVVGWCEVERRRRRRRGCGDGGSDNDIATTAEGRATVKAAGATAAVMRPAEEATAVAATRWSMAVGTAAAAVKKWD